MSNGKSNARSSYKKNEYWILVVMTRKRNYNYSGFFNLAEKAFSTALVCCAYNCKPVAKGAKRDRKKIFTPTE